MTNQTSHPAAAARRAPERRSFPRLLHGADYFPEQWLDNPEVLDR